MRIKFNFSQLAISLGVTSFSLLANLNKSEAKSIKLVDGNGRQAKVGQIVPQSEPPNLGFGIGKAPILEDGVLKHPDNRSYEVKYLPPNDVFNFDPLLMFMGAGQADPARINKQTGKFQLKINGVWRCVSASQPVSCNSKSTLRQKDFKKPLTAQEIREQLVRTGASKTSNEQIMAHINELGGVEKFLKATQPELTRQFSVQDPDASEGYLKNTIGRDKTKRTTFLKPPSKLSIEEQAIMIYKLLYSKKAETEVVLVLHGWNDLPSSFENLALTITKRKPNALVFLVDWSEGSWNGAGRVQILNVGEGLHLRAAKTIMPAAQATYNHLKELGVSFEQVSAFGHSLGSLWSAAFAKTVLNKNQVKINTLVAMDQPSNWGTSVVPKNISTQIGYDIDGNTKGDQRAIPFRDVANKSVSFVGDKSLAGSEYLAKAHYNFLVNLRSGISEGYDTKSKNPIDYVFKDGDIGGEHSMVPRVVEQLLLHQRLAGKTLDLLSNSWNLDLDKKSLKKDSNQFFDGMIFATPEYFKLSGYDSKQPSIDSFQFFKNRKLNIIGLSNSREIENQLTINRVYGDKQILEYAGTSLVTSPPLHLLSGNGKQTNCPLLPAEVYKAFSWESDNIDMSNADEAEICAYQAQVITFVNWLNPNQIDKVIGAKRNNTFMIIDGYTQLGNRDYMSIKGFNLNSDKIQVTKSWNYKTVQKDEQVKLYKAGKKGSWFFNWGGTPDELIAIIDFDSENKAEKFNLEQSLEKI